MTQSDQKFIAFLTSVKQEKKRICCLLWWKSVNKEGYRKYVGTGGKIV